MDTPISAGDRGSLVDALLDADLRLLESKASEFRVLGFRVWGLGVSNFGARRV